MEDKFINTFEYKLIYIFRINDGLHGDCLKIGDATIHTTKKFDELNPDSHDLNFAARKRIDSYTSTAGIVYELLYTEIAVYKNNKGLIKAFRDHNVHDVLKRSGINVKYFDTHKKQNEWFKTDLETAKKAIACVKNSKKSLNASEITTDNNPIVFRPEQLEAIKKTIKRYKDSNSMLWNAKMRFGKTLSALQVAKEMEFEKTIIITHRPVVSDGWYEDFKKIFFDKPEYKFGSKTYGESSIKKLIDDAKPFVYFASIQDLRGSALVGGKFDKNNEIFDIAWDFIVVDEAHEGTQTSLGKSVIEELQKAKGNKNPKILELSGTPFNLLTDFEEASIYTWDYIMEQEAKQDWLLNHFGDSNPYEELPKMNIYTYHLEKSIPGYIETEDKAFKFSEFFRIWTGDVEKDGKAVPPASKVGNFVHENDVKSFLDLICKSSNDSNYPFSTEEYRDYFRHTLWVVPGVKEAKALSTLLKQHHIFKNFDIVNVAGDGDEEIDTSNALKAVKDAMTSHPESTYTITLSCGRLTTGVSIPEWTAVLMLAGTYSTAASQYLQTIFRVQTPANIDGKMKENCFVFDFAPDRTLKMVAESVQLSARTKTNNPRAEIQLGAFLNYCPVISIDGTNMKEFKVGELLQELKKAYVERVVKNGFDDTRLYNDELLKLDDVDISEFDKLEKAIGSAVPGSKTNDIVINNEGFDKDEQEKNEGAQKKKKSELTEEEKKLLEELKKKKEQRSKAINILRAISVRIPLMVYGMDGDIDTEITIDNFIDLVDDVSWEEFMPKGVDKDTFKKFTKYYDKDMFIACARRIRWISKTADELEPTERVKKIARLFSTFKNTDKETVLTPWRVVNMHMGQTLGGYSFFDEKYEKEIENPVYIDNGDATKDTLSNKDACILEINSKTGLYPLYVTYSLFRLKLGIRVGTLEEQLNVWDNVVINNLYVICKTPMAKAITKRTLLGYRKGKINAHAFDDLLNQMKEKQEQLVKKIKNSGFWNKGGHEMKFNAVVGNPPYQEQIDNREEQPPIYHLFYEFAFKISDLVTLITPGRFIFDAGKTPKQWNKKMLNDEHFKVVKYYKNPKDVFNTVDIKGGILIGLRNKNVNFGAIKIFTENDILSTLLNKVKSKYLHSISDIAYSNTSYKYSKTFFTENPSYIERVSGGSVRYLSSSVFDKFPESFYEQYPKDNDKYALIYGRKNNQRLKLYFKEKYLNPPNNFKKYKVALPSSNGSGKLGEILTGPFIANPNEGFTETFLSFGSFDTLENSINLLKYFKTKFARIMLGTKKVTPGNKKIDVWGNVPLFSFDETDPINWKCDVKDIDKQLFEYFELSQEEIKFIDETAAPME